MNNTTMHINDIFNSFSPSEMQEERMLDAILNKSEAERTKMVKPFPRLKRPLIATFAAACLTLIVFGVMVMPNWMNSNPITDNPVVENPISENPTNPGGLPGTDRTFEGFVLVAYTANAPDGNIVSEANAVVLQPDVEIMLGAYSPIMSSVPGFPFRFDTEEGYETQVSVDNGTLCRWDMQNGIVMDEGSSTNSTQGEVLYWSPLTKDGELVENAVITVFAIIEGKPIGGRRIFITSEDGIYSAHVGA